MPCRDTGYSAQEAGKKQCSHFSGLAVHCASIHNQNENRLYGAEQRSCHAKFFI